MNTNDIVGLFSQKSPIHMDVINTSHGEDDFRETLLVDLGEEKIADIEIKDGKITLDVSAKKIVTIELI